MPVYEVRTHDDERIRPLEKSFAWRHGYGRINRRIEKILGPLSQRICMNASLYANPGKGWHIDVDAPNKEEAISLLEENRGVIEKVYDLFGEMTGRFEVSGMHPEEPSPQEFPWYKRLVPRFL